MPDPSAVAAERQESCGSQAAAARTIQPALAVRNLTLAIDGTRLSPVDDVSFDVWPGEILAIVGESGCGKSLTALATMRLLPPPIVIRGGAIRLDGTDLVPATEGTLRRIRGRSMAMIFQDPMTALNPVVPVGVQLQEPLAIHTALSRRQARARALELLRLVGVSDPERRLDAYPHQLSGGMRQRVVIAMMLACSPKVLIADEPTTALDVTVQAQILGIFRDLQRNTGLAMVLITHDLGVVARVADRVAVMYAGRIVETARVREIVARPRPPYTQALIRCARTDDGPLPRARHGMLPEIAGSVMPLVARGAFCAFVDRCGRAHPPCRAALPARIEVAPGHVVECWDAHRP
jgi:peptide/nickel transport system ATP-binding protein